MTRGVQTGYTMGMTQPLAPGEIRTATAPDGTTVTLMEVGNGGWITVQVRKFQGRTIYANTRPSTREAMARLDFAAKCGIYNAKI